MQIRNLKHEEARRTKVCFCSFAAQCTSRFKGCAPYSRLFLVLINRNSMHLKLTAHFRYFTRCDIKYFPINYYSHKILSPKDKIWKSIR